MLLTPKMASHQRYSLLFLLVTTIFLLQSCSDSEKSSKRKRHARAHWVTEYKISMQPIILNTTRTGTIEVKRSVKLFSQEEGVITKLTVDKGDHVDKDTLLIKIDDALIVALLAKASATREQARQNLIRNQRLSRKQLVSTDQLIKAQTSYKIATAEESLLKTRVNNTIIKAPFTGIITERNTDKDNFIAKHRHILTLIDPLTYIIKVQISELLIPHYKLNDTVSIQIDALGSKKVLGNIVRIHPTIDPATRQGTLEIKMHVTPAGTKAGQLCRVTLTSAPRSGLSIPFNSLRQDKDGEFVFVIVKGKKKPRKKGRTAKTRDQKQTPVKEQRGPEKTRTVKAIIKKPHAGKKPKRKSTLFVVKRQSVRSGLRHGTLVEIPEGLSVGLRIVKRGFLGLRPRKEVVVVNPNKSTQAKTPKNVYNK